MEKLSSIVVQLFSDFTCYLLWHEETNYIPDVTRHAEAQGADRSEVKQLTWITLCSAMNADQL